MYSFTETEKRDLLIGTAIFVLVELSFAIYYTNTFLELLILGILTIPLWLFHELAHKFVAQGNGLVSDFRLDPNMAIFSLFSIVLPIKIIAPGVVLSSGEYRLDTAGRISMAGPLTNILIGGIFLVFSSFMPIDWIVVVFLLASRFSFDMALFNMLPFYVLDGAKVLRWNQSIFILIFSLSVIAWLLHPLDPLRILGFLGGY